MKVPRYICPDDNEPNKNWKKHEFKRTIPEVPLSTDIRPNSKMEIESTRSHQLDELDKVVPSFKVELYSDIFGKYTIKGETQCRSNKIGSNRPVL